jgi:hypothetical protein
MLETTPLDPQSGAPVEAEDARRLIGARLRRVRRRLHARRFLRVFFQDFLAASVLFAIFLVVHRLVDAGIDPLAAFAAILGAALTASLVRGGLFGRGTLLDAAMLADDRLALKERLSSALYLDRPAVDGAGSRESWRSLIERDGARAIAAADLRASFPIRLPRTALWALAVVLLTLVVPWVLPQQDLFGWRGIRQADAAMKEQLAKQVEELKQSEELQELEKLADEKADAELKAILDALRQLEAKPEEKPEAAPDPQKDPGEEAKKNALVEMNRIEELLEKKTQKGDFEELNELLDSMRTARLDPSALTRELQKALKDGDLKKAGEELGKLEEELERLGDKQKDGALSNEELERLEKLQDELMALARSSAALSKLGQGLKGLKGAGLSSKDLAQMLRNLDQMKLDIKSLQELQRQLQTLQQSLELVKLSKQELAKLHKCPECGKLRKGGMQPGGT